MARTGGPRTGLRVVITLIILFLWFFAGKIPLPGVDSASFTAQEGSFGVTILGVMPWWTGSYFVAGLAVFVPSLARGTFGAPQSGLARAVAVAAVLTATIQALIMVAIPMESMRTEWGDSVVANPGWAFRVVLSATLVGWTLLGGLAARWIDRWGIGCGMALVLTSAYVAALVRAAATINAVEQPESLLPTVLVLIGIVALAWRLVRSPLPSAAEPGLTPGGLSPDALAAVTKLLPLVGLGALTAPLGILVAIGAGAVVTSLIAWLARRSRRVAVAASRYAPAEDRGTIAGVASGSVVTAVVRGALGAGGVLSILAFAQWWGAARAVCSNAEILLLISVVGVELCRFAGPSAGLTEPVWSTQKLYELGPAVELLAAGGVVAEPRGLAFRRLYPFAFFIPVELLVSPADRERATALLAQVRAPDSSPPPPPTSIASLATAPPRQTDSAWPGPMMGPPS